MSSRGSTLTEETHDFETEASQLNFDALLDTISNNMERAANVQFNKRAVDYALLSPPKRRHLNPATPLNDDRSFDLSFISNSRSFSRASDDHLPALLTTRSPSERDLGFLEALNNPEYLHAVKELAELPDSSVAYDSIRHDGGSEVDEDCVYFSSIMDKFEISERMLTDYLSRARSLFSLGAFHQEKDQLEFIEQRYQQILAKTDYIYERLGQLPPSEPRRPPQELSAIEHEISELEESMRQLEQTNSENSQMCEQLKSELAALKRKADERVDPLKAEKLRMQALEVDLARSREDLEGIKSEIASVTEEISQLEAQDTPHPYSCHSTVLSRRFSIISQISRQRAPLPRLPESFETFPREKCPEGVTKEDCLAPRQRPTRQARESGTPSTLTLGAFVMKRLFETPNVPLPLEELKEEARSKLGFDLERAETAIFDLASRDLIVIDHSSLLVALPSDDPM
ncbi:hypothetical protein L0F63_000756 [Massospora cicadina]|nr:hypothetical protein L0F63_000756 [Massospora cicadina]